VVAAPAAYPQHAAAEPTPQPAEQPAEAMQQAHVPGEAGTGIEEVEQLVAAAEVVVVNQEMEGTEDAAATVEVAIKQGFVERLRKWCKTFCKNDYFDIDDLTTWDEVDDASMRETVIFAYWHPNATNWTIYGVPALSYIRHVSLSCPTEDGFIISYSPMVAGHGNVYERYHDAKVLSCKLEIQILSNELPQPGPTVRINAFLWYDPDEDAYSEYLVSDENQTNYQFSIRDNRALPIENSDDLHLEGKACLPRGGQWTRKTLIQRMQPPTAHDVSTPPAHDVSTCTAWLSAGHRIHLS